MSRTPLEQEESQRQKLLPLLIDWWKQMGWNSNRLKKMPLKQLQALEYKRQVAEKNSAQQLSLFEDSSSRPIYRR